MNLKFARLVCVLFAICSVALLSGCDKEKGDGGEEEAGAPAATDGLNKIARGAESYFQEEHASPDGMIMSTRVFPDVSTQACGNDQDVWNDLHFEPQEGVEYCYVSAGGGKVFAAGAKEGDTVLCIKGSDGGGKPNIEAAEEVDSLGDCQP